MFVIGLSFIVALFIHGSIPAAEIEMLGEYAWKMGLSAFLLGIIAAFYGMKKPLMSTLQVTIGFAAAVLAKALYDVLVTDPTSHNLWPIEVLIVAGIAFSAAFVGTMIVKAYRSKQQNT